MASPFPGMDPFLEHEKLWPLFHHQLVNTLYQMLLPSLADRYRARVGTRQYQTEQVLFTSILREHHEEEYIEVRQRQDGRCVTLLEVVSPANKTSPAGRSAYLAKREEAKHQRAHMVEIDLVLQGQPLHDYSREGLPEWDYAVTVTRANQPDRLEVYTATIDKKLPRFRLPLAADDRDTVIDLSLAVTRSLDQNDLTAQIDYHKQPTTRLSDGHRAWLEQHLKQKGLR